MRTLLLITVLLFTGCYGASTYNGYPGVGSNPLNLIGAAPTSSTPTLSLTPGRPGPTIDAYPVMHQAVTKRVYIYPHQNTYGDVVGGHYLDVLYVPARYGDLAGAEDVRVPITPSLQPLHLQRTTATRLGSALELPPVLQLVAPSLGQNVEAEIPQVFKEKVKELQDQLRNAAQPSLPQE